MKTNLMGELNRLQKPPTDNAADVARWDEEIRIMLELKKHGCHTVFGGLNIDEQIKERQYKKRLVAAGH